MKIALFVISIILPGCTKEKDAVYISNWKMLADQTDSIETAANTKNWQPIKLPSMFKLPYKPIRGMQYIWLKGEFHIDNKPQDYFGLYAGRIYYLDKFYINGGFIGGHYQPEEINPIHLSRSYQINNGLLKSGKNDIFIRLGIYGAEYGGIPGVIRILPKKEFFLNELLDRFIYTQLIIGIAVILLGQLIFNLVCFILNKRSMFNIFSSAVFVIWIICIFLIFFGYMAFSHDLRITFQWACSSLVPIFFIFLIQSFYRIYLYKCNMIIIPFLSIITLIILINQNTISDYYPGRILGTAALVISCPILLYNLYKINKIRPDNSIYILLLFSIIPGSLIAWDEINYLLIYHYPPIFFPYTLLLFEIPILIIKIKSDARKEMELNDIYQKLNKSYKNDKISSITSTTEEKLEKIISFLKANFTSDISREGLANAIGISPDHMSRMFLLYTGQRIHEYINELRIKYAAEKLINTDEKIIHIAFSSGFESLATFNRVFLKNIGETPTEYRRSEKAKN